VIINWIRKKVFNLKVVEKPNKFLGINLTWLLDGSLKLSQGDLIRTLRLPSQMVIPSLSDSRDFPMESNWDELRSAAIDSTPLECSSGNVLTQYIQRHIHRHSHVITAIHRMVAFISRLHWNESRSNLPQVSTLFTSIHCYLF
jgi:hypothetical protein